jgi:Kdo2-lipid IVA lauroyltransferase/acyltransferase
MGNYYLYRIAYFVTRALPLKVSYALAIVIADCHYLLSKADRHAVEANLKIILKTDQVPHRKVREVFRNFGKYLVEFFTMSKHLNDEFIRDRVQIIGVEYVNDLLKEGKGCIAISAHVGNWEMAGAVLAKLGYPLSVVALPHKDPKVNKFFNEQREFFGSIVIPTTTAIRRCMEHAKANRAIAIVSERDFSQSGIVMNFLGKPTIIPKGAALFSLKTGAPIVSCFLTRVGDNFQIRFTPPIYPPHVGQKKLDDNDLKNYMQRYIGLMENEIINHPTQWLMFREFWVK